MGLFGKDDDSDIAKKEAEPDDDSFASRTSLAMVRRMVDAGIDGLGPFDPSSQIVAEALKEHPETEDAIDSIIRRHYTLAAAGGFMTGVGGLLTMPVALPANVVGFYLLAARMTGAVAQLRGYDPATEQTRTALMLTLLGADADDILQRAGVVGGGTMGAIALNRVPKAAAMVINKGLGFRVATQLGRRTLGRLGRAVPLAGGFIGAGLDFYLLKRIAGHVREEFPPV